MPKHDRRLWFQSHVLNATEPLGVEAVAHGLHRRRRGRGSLLPDGPDRPSGRAADAARGSSKTTDTNA